MHNTTRTRRKLAQWLVALAVALPLTPAVVGPVVPTALAATPMGATLSVLAAPVDVAPIGQGEFTAGVDGQTLAQGDAVRTGSGGIALLTFFDGSEAQLGGDSQVQIERAEANPSPQIALLQTAGVSVNHVIPMGPDGSFQTDTPAASGLVRGTSYIVIVRQGAECGVDGDDGCVASIVLLTDRSGHVGRVDVSANAAPGSVVELANAGAAATASSHGATAAQIAPEMLEQLEAAAHERDDPAAARITEGLARGVAETLAPLAAPVEIALDDVVPALVPSVLPLGVPTPMAGAPTPVPTAAAPPPPPSAVSTLGASAAPTGPAAGGDGSAPPAGGPAADAKAPPPAAAAPPPAPAAPVAHAPSAAAAGSGTSSSGSSGSRSSGGASSGSGSSGGGSSPSGGSSSSGSSHGSSSGSGSSGGASSSSGGSSGSGSSGSSGHGSGSSGGSSGSGSSGSGAGASKSPAAPAPAKPAPAPASTDHSPHASAPSTSPAGGGSSSKPKSDSPARDEPAKHSDTSGKSDKSPK
jgi:hypothetical protein